MNDRLKAVIFDMGGVLLRTVDKEPRRKLAARFGTTVEELENFVFLGETSLKSEVGEISDIDHWRAVLNRYDEKHLSEKELYRQFFSGDELNHKLLDYADQLKPDFQIALLSNAWTNTRENLKSLFDFVDRFDIVIFSAEVGFRKPGFEIFRIMLNRLEVRAHEAVFIDDMSVNVAGAQSVGMHAIQFSDTSSTINKLDILLEKED